MPGALTRLRENEPLQLILWPTLGAIATILVGKGVIDRDGASLLMAVAVTILGGSGIMAARDRVTPDAHLPDAVAAGAQSAINRVRGQVGDTLGDSGLAALDQIEGMIQAAATRTGRHERHGL